MATTIKAALEQIVERLTEAGVEASVDPADLNPPAVWVSVGTIDPAFLNGDGMVTIRCNLIVPDVAYPDVLKLLDDTLGDVIDALDVFGDVTPESVVMPDGSTLPSYRVETERPYTRTE